MLPPASVEEEAPSAAAPRRLPYRVLTLVSVVFAVAVVAVGVGSSLVRDGEGYLMGVFVIPLAVGCAALLVGLAPARWRRAAMWAGVAFVGQAVVLQVVDAGTSLHYQHYDLPHLLTAHRWFTVFLAIQAGVVIIALARRWRAIRRCLAAVFSVPQLIGIGALVVLTSATLSRDVVAYGLELLFATFAQLVILGTVVLAVWALPREELAGLATRFRAWFRRWEGLERGLRPDRVAVACAIWVTLLTGILNVLSYEMHPHVPDEVVYLRHAQYLAEGMLTMDVPAVPEAFEHYLMDISERGWYVVSPHGWPLVLALGWWVGMPWLVNPLLAGLNVLLSYVFLRALYSRRVAQAGVLLFAVSPWYLFLGMSFMNHMSTLACALIAALAVVYARRTGAVWYTWGGGLALGMLALLRPLEAVVIAGLLGLWMLGIGGSRLRVAQMAGLVLGAVGVALTLLLYNDALTGDPFLFPINVYIDANFHPNANALGFGPDRGMGWDLDPYPGHGLRDVLVNANLNASTLNTELFGWGTGSLLLLGVALFSGRLRRSDRLMVATIAAVFVALAFYYFSGGPDFGPRYWFLMILPCVALTVRGASHLTERLRTQTADGDCVRWRVGIGVALLCAIALTVFVPWRAADKYHHFRGMRPDIRHLMNENELDDALVLVRGEMHPDYASALVYNPIDLSAPVPIFAWDRGPEVREALREAFPNRPVWVVEGPSITGQGYRVVSSPVSSVDTPSRPHAP